MDKWFHLTFYWHMVSHECWDLSYNIVIIWVPEDYPQTSDISHTLIDNKIVDHSDVVGVSPVSAASTTSSFWTSHLALMDWAKTTARPDEQMRNISVLEFDASHIRGLMVYVLLWPMSCVRVMCILHQTIKTIHHMMNLWWLVMVISSYVAGNTVTANGVNQIMMGTQCDR